MSKVIVDAFPYFQAMKTRDSMELHQLAQNHPNPSVKKKAEAVIEESWRAGGDIFDLAVPQSVEPAQCQKL